MKKATSKAATGGLRRNGSFVLFWGGETISLFGTQVTLLALPLTALISLRANPAQLGLIRFAESVPYVLFTLLFGAWADRRRRKPLLVLANAGRSMLIGLVPLLFASDLLGLSVLTVLAFTIGVLTVLFDVTWMACLPGLVAPKDLVEANGKVAASSSAAEVVGPGLGGALVQLITAPLALIADALSYLVAAISLVLIREPERAVEQRDTKSPSLWREIRAGLGFVWSDDRLRSIMLLSGLWNLLFGVADTAFMLYAVRDLGLAPATFGTIFAIAALGGLFGSAFSTRLCKRNSFGPILGVAFAFGTLPWALLPLVSGPTILMAIVFSGAFFLIRFGLGLWGVVTTTFRQSITPGPLLARVGASLRFVSYGLGSFGFMLSGGNADFNLPF